MDLAWLLVMGSVRLTGVSGLSGYAMEEQRPAGYCLGMLLGLGKADKQVPPVVDQGNEAAGQTAALELLGCVTIPTLLVLEFVETVFAIGPIAMQLGQGEYLRGQRGHQHDIFITAHGLGAVDKSQV